MVHVVPPFGPVIAAAFLAAVFYGTASVQAATVDRIVSLAPSVTEILFALGVGDRLVGVSTYCDHPPEAAKIDRIGTFLSPNVELILAKRPDLVIGVPSPGNREPVEMLESMGLRIVIVEPERVSAILSAIRTIAGAVGVADAGETLVGSIEEKMAAVLERLKEAPRPKVLMVVGRRPLVAVGKGSYQDELIELAHGTNIAAQTGERWPNLTIEFVLEQAPEVIIDAGMGSEELDRDAGAAFWRTFASLPAVREDRIYGYQAYELLRPGPRVPETLEIIARYIHPERFRTPSPAKRGRDGEGAATKPEGPSRRRNMVDSRQVLRGSTPTARCAPAVTLPRSAGLSILSLKGPLKRTQAYAQSASADLNLLSRGIHSPGMSWLQWFASLPAVPFAGEGTGNR